MPDEPSPANDEAEESVLGTLLMYPAECGPVYARSLTDTHFLNAPRATVFATAMRQWHDLHGLDVVTVTDALRKTGKLEAVGGASYVTSLLDHGFTASNAEYYGDAVLEAYRLRRVWTVSAELRELSSKPHASIVDISATLARLQGDLTAHKNNSARSMKEHVGAFLDRIEANATNPNAIREGVIPTGIDKLDAKLTGGGLRPSRLYIVAADSSYGKTALSMQFGVEGAVRRGKDVLVVSYEMEAEELTERLFATVSGVSATKFSTGVFTEVEFARLTRAAQDLSQAGIHLRDEVGHWTVDDVANEARAIKAKHGLGLIVVDYIQLISPAPAAKGRQINREREVAAMSAALKKLAKELRVPIVAPSQVTDGKVRESRAILHDADVVLRIEDSLDDTKKPKEDERRIWIDKQRGGVRDKSITVSWCGVTTKFG